MGWIPCGVDCSMYTGGKFIIGSRMPWIVNSEGKFNKIVQCSGVCIASDSVRKAGYVVRKSRYGGHKARMNYE